MSKKDTMYNFAELHAFSLKTILTPEWKYIYNFKDETEYVYNITLDPSETNNVIDKETEQGKLLKKHLDDWVAGSKKYPTTRNPFTLTEEEQKQLEVLGYLPHPTQ
jgi:hypothetical protein